MMENYLKGLLFKACGFVVVAGFFLVFGNATRKPGNRVVAAASAEPVEQRVAASEPTLSRDRRFRLVAIDTANPSNSRVIHVDGEKDVLAEEPQIVEEPKLGEPMMEPTPSR